jgi:phage shock protein PspC (stress-responsive transcriptional regulator)
MRHDAGMSNMSGGKALVRSRNNRIVAGVCAGVADYLGMDTNLVRVLAAVLTLLTGVVGGVLVYLVAWAVIPEEGQKSSIAEDLINKNRQG